MVRVLLLFCLTMLMAVSPCFAQRGAYDPAERLKAMDTNNDGKLEEEEIPERFRSFMMDRFKDAGLDTSKPVDIKSYLEAREQRDDDDRRRDDNDDRRRDGDRDRDDRQDRDDGDDRLVPGFGESVDLPEVPGFGGDLGDGGSSVKAQGIPLEDRYHERIIGYVEGILRRYDRNGDRILDRDEWRRGRWRDPGPEESDKNNDGRLTREELCQRISGYDEFASLSSPSSSSSSSGSSGGSSSSDNRTRYDQYAKSLLDRYDGNKNGVLEENEWKKMSGYHHAADANKDKVITRDELIDRLASYGNRSRGSSRSSDRDSDDRDDVEPGESYRVTGESTKSRITTDVERLPKGLPDWFARNDANADGQISMAEFSVSWTSDKLDEFRTFDRNGDGMITPQECGGAPEKKDEPSRSSSRYRRR